MSSEAARPARGAPMAPEAEGVDHGGVLTIDLDAIRANYRMLKARSRAMIAGVVKADAYGLGIEAVAPALWAEGCRTFFVALLREGIALRRHLPQDAEIFVLNGIAPGNEVVCAAHALRPVLNSLPQVAAWTTLAAAKGRPLAAALQVDSGMSRLGLSPGEVEILAKAPDRLQGIDVVLVMSHLACADDPDHPANAAQRTRFESLARSLPKARLSLANSAGLFLPPDFHFDLARPGIALYGGAPQTARHNPMRPVFRLEARVAQIRHVAAGAGIGYGFTRVAERPMRLATIGVGYADGWPRSLGERAAAFAGTCPLPVVGRISMDSTILDISDPRAADLKEGDLVDLVGPEQSLDTVAEAAGTIPYEILTSLGRRFARHVLGRTA